MDFKTYLAAGGADPECVLFQKMASTGHMGSGGGSKQGIYICTPAGKRLASNNSLNAQSVKKMMEQALEDWQNLPEHERIADSVESKPDHRWEWNYPEDGLVLKLTARYLSGATLQKQQPDKRFNFDYAWFGSDEVKSFLTAAPVVGKKYELPQPLFERFVRCHLLDTAQGESGTFRSDEISGKFEITITEVNATTIKLELAGLSSAAATKSNVGYYRVPRIEAEVYGFASYQRQQNRFDKFEMVGKGKIFRSIEPEADESPARHIGWYFTLADPDSPAERLFPSYIYAYEADWLEKPAVELQQLHRQRK